jgi:hypothetical protein
LEFTPENQNGGKGMNKSKEQRKHTRVKTHIAVKYRKLRDGAGAVGTSSVSRNLSQGGIRFKASDFISMACRLIVEMDFPIFNKPVRAISRVAWIRKTDSGEDFEVGNQFVEMSKQDRELISEYIENLDPSDDSEDSLEDEEKNTDTILNM